MNIFRALDKLQSAARISRAVNEGRTPRDYDLDVLGLKEVFRNKR